VSNNYKVKLADFGLARCIDFSQHDESEKPILTTKVITLWYRPLELLLGNSDYGTGIDMWSVGCIIVEMITHRPLFGANSEMALMETVYNTLGTPTKSQWEKMKPKDSRLEPPDSRKGDFQVRSRGIVYGESWCNCN